MQKYSNSNEAGVRKFIKDRKKKGGLIRGALKMLFEVLKSVLLFGSVVFQRIILAVNETTLVYQVNNKIRAPQLCLCDGVLQTKLLLRLRCLSFYHLS